MINTQKNLKYPRPELHPNQTWRTCLPGVSKLLSASFFIGSRQQINHIIFSLSNSYLLWSSKHLMLSKQGSDKKILPFDNHRRKVVNNSPPKTYHIWWEHCEKHWVNGRNRTRENPEENHFPHRQRKSDTAVSCWILEQCKRKRSCIIMNAVSSDTWILTLIFSIISPSPLSSQAWNPKFQHNLSGQLLLLLLLPPTSRHQKLFL